MELTLLAVVVTVWPCAKLLTVLLMTLASTVFSLLETLSTTVSSQDGFSEDDVGVGALHSIAAAIMASASLERLRFCAVIRMRLFGAPSGIQGRMFFATAFGFGV